MKGAIEMKKPTNPHDIELELLVNWALATPSIDLSLIKAGNEGYKLKG